MKRILDGMQKTMMAVKPPRYTALEGLQKAETAKSFQNIDWNCAFRKDKG